MASFTCPVDGTVLVPVERSGIEIDHCPSCRGVWLDRGELDKMAIMGALSLYLNLINMFQLLLGLMGQREE